MATPAGELRTLATPHTAAGPSLRELALGSEGVLGAITEVTVRVRPAPEARRYEAWVAADFASGRELVRSLAQADALPDVIRLSDETETRVSLGLAGDRGRAAGAARRLPAPAPPQRRLPGDLRLGGRARVGRPAPSAVGAPAAPRRRRGARRGARARLGARPLRRPVPARRADGPRLHGRDARDLAHLVAPRRALPRRSAARSTRALRAQGTPGIVMCHLSHAYRDGASLYFTFVARGAPRRRDRAVAGGEDRGLRGDRRRRRARSPTTTPSAATTRRTWRPRWGRRASRRCGRSRSASTRPGS